MARQDGKPKTPWDPKTRRFFGIAATVFGLLGVFVVASRLAGSAAVRAVEALGGTAAVDAGPAPELATVDLSGRPITDSDLARLHSYFFWARGPAALNLSGTGVSDAGLAHLSGLPFLSKLDLSRTRISGPGLVHLSSMGFIGHEEGSLAVELNLSHTNIDDAALITISRMPRLQTLDLSHTRISGATLPQLGALPDLSQLILTGCIQLDGGAVAALRRQRPQLSVIL